jgi:hypothetical protein
VPPPTVSVLLPVRNGARFLALALDSLIGQANISHEIIAIDDGSRDETPTILRRYAALHDGLRIVAGQGDGLSHALNLGLVHARGRYIARMDADDIALPGRFAAQCHYLDRHPAIGVLGTQALRIDPAGIRSGQIRVPTGPRRVRAALGISCALIHPTVMLRRKPLLAVGGYRPQLDGAEDYDLWLRLSEITELDNLREPWLLWRQHNSQVSTRYALRQARRAALALLSHQWRRKGAADPLADQQTLRGWRYRFSSMDSTAVLRLHALTAAAFVDNGGSLRRRGSAYLEAICKRIDRHDQALTRRIALACVRHQRQLVRAGRWREALARWPVHLASCDTELLRAYFTHASILWRS